MTFPVALHVHRWNPGVRRRALLLHGLGSDARTMWRLADALAADGYEVAAPDLRGHGLSPSATGYSVAEYTADVRLLGPGWDLVVGHSLGGTIAARLLADDRFAARGLLLDPVLRLEPDDRRQLEADLAAEVGGTLTAAALRAQHPGWDDEDVFRKVAASALVSPVVTRDTLDHNDPWDVMADAVRWRRPVVVVAADPQHGALFLPAHADELRSAGVELQVETLDGCGHSVHRESPDRVLELLRGSAGGS